MPQDNGKQIGLLSPNEIFSSTAGRIRLVRSSTSALLGEGAGEGAQHGLPKLGVQISLFQPAAREQGAAPDQAEKMLQRGGRRRPART